MSLKLIQIIPNFAKNFSPFASFIFMAHDIHPCQPCWRRPIVYSQRLKKGKNVKWIIGADAVNLPVHDGLKDGGKRRNSDTSPYKNGVLCPVEVARGTPKWSVYVNLEG